MLVLKHGGRVPPTKGNGAKTAYAEGPMPPIGTPFDYLLPDLKTQKAARLSGVPSDVNAALRALGKAMVDQTPPVAVAGGARVNSVIPAIYTYWGQFIDHDMTANTDRDGSLSNITKTPVKPVDPITVTNGLRNLRRPTFDLDSLYGNGPGLDQRYFCPDPGPPDRWLYKGAKFRIGENLDVGGGIPPVEDLRRDLPRIGPLITSGEVLEADLPSALRPAKGDDRRALIADSRNDENLIVAQFHLAFLRFHNRVVDVVTAYPQAFGLDHPPTEAEKFETARRLTKFHYQWLVVHDYLQTICLPGIVDKVLIGGNRFYRPLAGGELFAPLEYSVAAFRFGHSMVRAAYDHNRVFGIPPAGPPNFATFEQLFEFTGGGFVLDPADPSKSIPNPLGGAPTLPSNWIIEWDRMTNKVDDAEGHFARKIDTLLAPPVLNMVNQGNGEVNPGIRQLLRDLAGRNLLRGYLLGIPTGQAVASEMGVEPLTEDELRAGNTPALNDALDLGGFVKQTPLWYYLLKEAEVRANGNSLGELGSRIVVETQVGLLRNDANSYLFADTDWDPSQGVKLDNGDPIVTIRDFLHFAGLPA